MTRYKWLSISKLIMIKNANEKENTLTNSSSLLLQNPGPYSKENKKTKTSFIMALKKLKQCVRLKNVQPLLTTILCLVGFIQVSADARKFQPNSDITTNIITDPKSVASIDFR